MNMYNIMIYNFGNLINLFGFNLIMFEMFTSKTYAVLQLMSYIHLASMTVKIFNKIITIVSEYSSRYAVV